MSNYSARLPFVAFVVCASVSMQGCAMTAKEIAESPTWNLCGVYAAPLNPHYFDPVVKAELDRRGAGACTNPAVVQAKANASNSLIQQGNAMMSQANAPQNFAPPAIGSITAMKSSELLTGMTKQCFYSFGVNQYTRTINSTAICPLSIQVQ